jgi:Polyketide cyclase / dehydrase and lipid transport
MDLDALRASATITVSASPEKAYGIIADITRMGELSPVCRSAAFEDGFGPSEGGWFIGQNQAGDLAWETWNQILVARPPSEFAWQMCGGQPVGRPEGEVPDPESGLSHPRARWGYRFTPVNGGTEVEESWRLQRLYPRIAAMSDEQQQALVQGTHRQIVATLSALKRVAEQD